MRSKIEAIVGFRYRRTVSSRRTTRFFRRIRRGCPSFVSDAPSWHSLARARTRRDDADMSAEDDDDEKGPTIFEAAADEEIQENHWCARRIRPRA
jgi:hypothetical protein